MLEPAFRIVPGCWHSVAHLRAARDEVRRACSEDPAFGSRLREPHGSDRDWLKPWKEEHLPLTELAKKKQPDLAIPLYERCISIREKKFGHDSLEVAEPLDNLSALYSDRGDYLPAEALYKRSLSIYEKALGDQNKVVAINLESLAKVYVGERRDDLAQPLLLRSKAIMRKLEGAQ